MPDPVTRSNGVRQGLTRRQLALSTVGGLLLADGFAPWYRVWWGPPGNPTENTETASAWASSSMWTAGVLLAVAAVIIRLAVARLCPRPILRSTLALWAPMALCGVAWYLLVSTWYGALSPELRGASGPSIMLPAAPGENALIVRDQLYAIETTAFWGFYVALALVPVIAVLLLLSRHDSAENPSPRAS